MSLVQASEHLYLPVTTNWHSEAFAFNFGTYLWKDSPWSCLRPLNCTLCTTGSTERTAIFLFSVSGPTISRSLWRSAGSQQFNISDLSRSSLS